MVQPFAYQSQPAQADQQPTNTTQFDDERAAMMKGDKLAQAMKSVVSELEAEARRRVGLRQAIENRWIEDLEQYHSRYDSETEKVLISEERSRLFINLTRPKTNAMGARFKDLLFPTDEKNWGIQPTPVPRMTEAAEAAAGQARDLEQQALQAQQQATQPQQAQGPQGQPPQQPDPAAQQKADALTQQANAAKEAWGKLNAVLEEGRRRSELMAETMDDQLTECGYQAIKRDQIDWAMKIGTGVTKGPVTGDRVRRGWKQKPVQGQDGKPIVDETTKQPKVDGPHYLDMAEGDQPGFRLVDPWGFFPDMDVAKIEDGNGVYERHLMNPKKMRELQRLKNFDVDALRRLLMTKPISNAPAYISQLRNIRSEAQDVSGPVYHVWEYNGPLEPEQMRMLALATNNEVAYQLAADVDPLTQVNACVWFCDSEVLKFALYPYDSGECMYSVFNLVKDESSVFGYGMPAILRDLQSAFNAAWRTMMDNAGISSGPQVVVDKSTIEPADGDWKIRPRKIWYSTKGITKENPPFQIFQIQNNQAELANIIILAERLTDVVSTMPQIAQGEMGAMPKNTPFGTTVLSLNNANVVFRDGIKNFDDDVTVPDLRRLYDWNMQFSPKEEIKGDYDVKAMGSSVLLVREMQAQSLMAIAMNFGGHPVYGPMLKNRDLLRKIFQAHMIPADEVMLSDEQIDAVLAIAAKQAEQDAKAGSSPDNSMELQQIKRDIQMDRIKADIELANMEGDYRLKAANYARDTAMMTLASAQNMDMEKLRAMMDKGDKDNQVKLAMKKMDTDSAERKLAVEAAVTASQPAQEQHGGGSL
ncbi:hypothetical protein NL532_24110 [Mesorhizobium sp. C120A]|uniref:hypothetical protein n=1 Tax=unclassified Mesorhizobium TaxID=325217 RepID=UPI0003D05525|nr:MULTISPECIES: hypothetical protein [unclassified Mesorhizobium]ESZ60658.1 hypothetical protein X728_15065 [Mesorhizobium sp. L103C120A0]WJI43694.1 hypothetical protein NL532_24110 [Mesorhizobium sp. C120A]